MGCRALNERYKTCPACGRVFECLRTGCWCEEVTLDAPARAALRERYQDCLCPGCLQGHAMPTVSFPAGR